MRKATINFILVNPSHPGNIGAAARALKVMGFSKLTLVQPKKFPHAEATARAAGAEDLLTEAIVTTELTEAVKDASIIIGCSARARTMTLPMVNPKELVTICQSYSHTETVAILFGRENNGLTNEELAICNYHLYIPANPQYSSLNLASAVQIIAYELSSLKKLIPPLHLNKLATNQTYANFYNVLEKKLTALGYPNSTALDHLKNIFNRAILTEKELQLLHGLIKAIKH